MRERLWGNTLDHLIVDEVSMIPGEFWDRLDWEVRNVRSYGAMAHVRGDRTGSDFDHVNELPPFGGIQLMGRGDLLQLPPVEAGYGAAVAKNMAFDADAPARVTREPSRPERIGSSTARGGGASRAAASGRRSSST